MHLPRILHVDTPDYRKKTVPLRRINGTIHIKTMFENLRLKAARLLLRRKSARTKRQKMLFDFASAKYVGIVCSTGDEADTAHLKAFLYYLAQRKIKYRVLGYFDGKKIPENFLYWKDIEFFTRKDLNFLLTPNTPVAGQFMNEPFDMLINCSIERYFPVEYIARLSPAKCKVGVAHGEDTSYDLTIDIRNRPTVEYLMENLKIYLSNITKTE